MNVSHQVRMAGSDWAHTLLENQYFSPCKILPNSMTEQAKLQNCQLSIKESNTHWIAIKQLRQRQSAAHDPSKLDGPWMMNGDTLSPVCIKHQPQQTNVTKRLHTLNILNQLTWPKIQQQYPSQLCLKRFLLLTCSLRVVWAHTPIPFNICTGN